MSHRYDDMTCNRLLQNSCALFLGQGCNDPEASQNSLGSGCALQGTAVCGFDFSIDSQTFVLVWILWEAEVREMVEIHYTF